MVSALIRRFFLMRLILTFCLLFAAPPLGSWADKSSAPRPIPLTRPTMKKYLEDMKERKPRIPLPELTEEEKAANPDRSRIYESRLRSVYMPGLGDGRGGSAPGRAQTDAARSNGGNRNNPGGQTNEPGMTLDYRFKTSLFWIVSRTNNCQYCLGHQESKLLRAGMVEDEIAALDCDWSVFSPAEQTAFAFARRLTLEPNLLGDRDIVDMRKHYTDLQILEIILSVAGNNSINRWKEGAGIPQSTGGGGFGRPAEGTVAETKPEEHSYLTATSEKFSNTLTKVAPAISEKQGDQPLSPTVFTRPKLEPCEEAEAALASAVNRTPRLPLVDEAKAREALGDAAPEGTLPQWMRLAANFPVSGKRLVTTIRNGAEKGDLSPLLKAQASWIIARQDRAWYALGEAKQRLQKLGQTSEQIYDLDDGWKSFSPADQAMFTVAKNLAASPVVLTDDEVAKAVELCGPRDVVQLISYTTNRAQFDRITEAAGLAIDE
jgi:hypothetical protein